MMSLRERRGTALRWAVPLWVVLAHGGCKCGSGGKDDGGPVQGGDGGPDAAGDGGPAVTGGPCETFADCAAGLVCDPPSGVCTTSGGCSTHADCGVGAYCGAGGVCVENVPGGPCEIDANCAGGAGVCDNGFCGCGGALYTADVVPANVLIVLDRSGSMNDPIAGGATKWEVALLAITDLLASYGGGVNFGLMLYPGTNQDCSAGMDCGPGAVFVDPAPMTSGAIDTFLAGASTCMFGTPTAEALNALQGYAGLMDLTRANYVLLITDGMSTCADPVPEVTALRGQVPEVRTFVVGFGDGVDPVELEDMATAGGTTPPPYYVADSVASLAAAFSSIAGMVLSCTYTLSGVPADLGLLFVYQDGTLVTRDPTGADGWDYDPATGQLTFYGTACDALTSGLVTDIVFSYGCEIL